MSVANEVRTTLTTTDGASIAYWLRRSNRGDGPLVVLLHGAASNHTRWSELLRISAALQLCDTLRPDLRGNAESMWRGRLDLGRWADDVIELIGNESRDRSILVGHSLGAQIALRIAAMQASLVSALVLIDPVFPRTLRGGWRLLWRARPFLKALVPLVHLANACRIRRPRFPARDLEELDRETRRELRESRDPHRLAKKYSSVRWILPYMPVANYLQQLLATVESPGPPEQLRMPILALLSAGSTVASSGTVEGEIDRFPDADRAFIQADHWPLTENPDQVCAELDRWLSERHLLPVASTP